MDKQKIINRLISLQAELILTDSDMQAAGLITGDDRQFLDVAEKVQAVIDILIKKG